MIEMKNTMTRRQMIDRLATSMPLFGVATSLFGADNPRRKRLGVCTYSYNIHWKAARDGHPKVRFKDTIEFLEYCHQLGAGGVQIGVGSRDVDYPKKLRAKAEGYEMYFEGQASLPQQSSDVDRFDAEIHAAREAGAGVVRTAMLGGRRYETFDSAEAFRQFAEKSWQSLTLAEPVLKKHRVRLAIENHKDRRLPEMLDMLKHLSSEYVGVCVDVGNNIALLEEPMAVVEALAPFAFSTHLKDMAVQEYEEGFLLSEVPLGEGFLDLKKMIVVLQKANPTIQFNLEMITRDPLKIPCLTKKYWATMEAVPAAELAGALAMVRKNAAKKPLPRTTGLDSDRQLALEDENVKASFAYARERLEL
jgi:sugar phosphate isomerase/epimerase